MIKTGAHLFLKLPATTLSGAAAARPHSLRGSAPSNVKNLTPQSGQPILSYLLSSKEALIKSLSAFILGFLCNARNGTTRIASYLRSPMTKQCIRILIKADSANESVLPQYHTQILISVSSQQFFHGRFLGQIVDGIDQGAFAFVGVKRMSTLRFMPSALGKK